MVDNLFYRKVHAHNYPKLTFVFPSVATNLFHSRARSHLSIAFPPSGSSYHVLSSIAHPPAKSSSGIATSIALPPSKSISKDPTKKWKHGSMDSPISHHKHHYSQRKNHILAPGPTYPIQAPTYSNQGLIL